MKGKEGGGPIRGLQTDHVISMPIRGVEKTSSDGANKQTDRGHGNFMTESAQWGRFRESSTNNCNFEKKIKYFTQEIYDGVFN